MLTIWSISRLLMEVEMVDDLLCGLVEKRMLVELKLFG
jgi:hypothetical protein